MNIPGFLISNGFSLENGAYGQSIMSITSAVGRISASLISDYSWFPKPFGFFAGLLIILVTMIGMFNLFWYL